MLLFDAVVADAALSSSTKAKICGRIAHVDSALIDGADEYLQLLDIGGTLLHALTQ